MKNRTARRLAALGAAVALLVAGCSSSDKESDTASSPEPTQAATVAPADLEALKKVEVDGKAGAAPTLKFETPFKVSAPALHIIEEGSGDAIKDGDTISIQSVTYSGTTGEVVEGSNTFERSPEALVLDPAQVVPLLIDTLVGQKVGTRFLYSNPPADEEGSYVLAVEVTGTKETPEPLERATGEAVEPAADLPKVTLDDAGKPSIEIPKGFTTDKLIVQPLIKGEGEKVTEDQTITANYTGWKLDGTVFDSSWEKGQPASFPLQGVIKGWTEGLSGQTVGSQVLLVIPPELGYGDNKGHELEKETLVFVVDILAAA